MIHARRLLIEVTAELERAIGLTVHPEGRPARILVVEDDDSYREALATALGREGYDVQLAADGLEGLRSFSENLPDIVLLDVMLPGLAGTEVCRRMQELEPSIPIIMATALNAEADVVLGLELGAADYVTKPFHLRELIARIQSLLRRVALPAKVPESSRTSQPSEAPNRVPVSVGPITVDFGRREVRVNDRPVHLSRREFDVLAVLASPPGQVRTRDELIDLLWSNTELADTRTLDTHIRRLRTKLEPDPASPRYLITVRGVGFRLDHE